MERSKVKMKPEDFYYSKGFYEPWSNLMYLRSTYVIVIRINSIIENYLKKKEKIKNLEKLSFYCNGKNQIEFIG